MPSKAYRDWMGFVGWNPLECLAGLPVEVIFRSFADLERSGIPEGVNAILNMGEAGCRGGAGGWGGLRRSPPEVFRLRPSAVALRAMSGRPGYDGQGPRPLQEGLQVT